MEFFAVICARISELIGAFPVMRSHVRTFLELNTSGLAHVPYILLVLCTRKNFGPDLPRLLDKNSYSSQYGIPESDISVCQNPGTICAGRAYMCDGPGLAAHLRNKLPLRYAHILTFRSCDSTEGSSSWFYLRTIMLLSRFAKVAIHFHSDE